MKICHVTPHLPPDQAANALLPADLGRWAAARGNEVRWLSHEPAQGRLAPDDLPGRVTRLPRRERASGISGALRLDTWRYSKSIAAALDAIARDADLLHLHSNGLIIEVAALWARQRSRPFVLTLYGTEIWHYRPRWPIDPFTRAYRSATDVIFYSRRLLDRARELALDRTGMSVIYPAVSPAFQPRDGATRRSWRAALGIAEPLVVLNVKRLHELAGQRFLIDAFAKATRGRNDVRLIICGTGPLRKALEQQARDTGVGSRVTFTGLISNDEVARYAAVADLFVLPSLLEALPTVAVEALASGTPVVSADHPGGVELHELFGDDVLVVPRGNVDVLARAIDEFLRQPQRARAESITRVQQDFSASAVESAYSAVYERAIGQRQRSEGKGHREGTR
jgi:glycosyltransferase involved in cell wall biosynthesis